MSRESRNVHKPVADFTKKKRKVGKTNPLSSTSVKTDFTTKAINVPLQSFLDKPETSSQAHSHLHELLSKLVHYNASVRKDTINNLNEFFTRYEGTFFSNISHLITRFGEVMTDLDGDVRVALIRLFYQHLPSVPETLMEPFFATLIQYILTIANNIDLNIRADSLHLLRLVMILYPQLVSGHATTLLLCFPALLAEKDQLIQKHTPNYLIPASYRAQVREASAKGVHTNERTLSNTSILKPVTSEQLLVYSPTPLSPAQILTFVLESILKHCIPSLSGSVDQELSKYDGYGPESPPSRLVVDPTHDQPLDASTSINGILSSFQSELEFTSSTSLATSAADSQAIIDGNPDELSLSGGNLHKIYTAMSISGATSSSSVKDKSSLQYATQLEALLVPTLLALLQLWDHFLPMGWRDMTSDQRDAYEYADLTASLTQHMDLHHKGAIERHNLAHAFSKQEAASGKKRPDLKRGSQHILQTLASTSADSVKHSLTILNSITSSIYALAQVDLMIKRHRFLAENRMSLDIVSLQSSDPIEFNRLVAGLMSQSSLSRGQGLCLPLLPGKNILNTTIFTLYPFVSYDSSLSLTISQLNMSVSRLIALYMSCVPSSLNLTMLQQTKQSKQNSPVTLFNSIRVYESELLLYIHTCLSTYTELEARYQQAYASRLTKNSQSTPQDTPASHAAAAAAKDSVSTPSVKRKRSDPDPDLDKDGEENTPNDDDTSIDHHPTSSDPVVLSEEVPEEDDAYAEVNEVTDQHGPTGADSSQTPPSTASQFGIPPLYHFIQLIWDVVPSLPQHYRAWCVSAFTSFFNRCSLFPVSPSKLACIPFILALCRVENGANHWRDSGLLPSWVAQFPSLFSTLLECSSSKSPRYLLSGSSGAKVMKAINFSYLQRSIVTCYQYVCQMLPAPENSMMEASLHSCQLLWTQLFGSAMYSIDQLVEAHQHQQPPPSHNKNQNHLLYSLLTVKSFTIHNLLLVFSSPCHHNHRLLPYDEQLSMVKQLLSTLYYSSNLVDYPSPTRPQAQQQQQQQQQRQSMIDIVALLIRQHSDSVYTYEDPSMESCKLLHLPLSTRIWALDLVCSNPSLTSYDRVVFLFDSFLAKEVPMVLYSTQMSQHQQQHGQQEPSSGGSTSRNTNVLCRQFGHFKITQHSIELILQLVLSDPHTILHTSPTPPNGSRAASHGLLSFVCSIITAYIGTITAYLQQHHQSDQSLSLEHDMYCTNAARLFLLVYSLQLYVAIPMSIYKDLSKMLSLLFLLIIPQCVEQRTASRADDDTISDFITPLLQDSLLQRPLTQSSQLLTKASSTALTFISGGKLDQLSFSVSLLAKDSLTTTLYTPLEPLFSPFLVYMLDMENPLVPTAPVARQLLYMILSNYMQQFGWYVFEAYNHVLPLPPDAETTDITPDALAALNHLFQSPSSTVPDIYNTLISFLQSDLFCSAIKAEGFAGQLGGIDHSVVAEYQSFYTTLGQLPYQLHIHAHPQQQSDGAAAVGQRAFVFPQSPSDLRLTTIFLWFYEVAVYYRSVYNRLQKLLSRQGFTKLYPMIPQDIFTSFKRQLLSVVDEQEEQIIQHIDQSILH